MSRIDFRVGKILSAKHHPDADALFVQESKLELLVHVLLLFYLARNIIMCVGIKMHSCHASCMLST